MINNMGMKFELWIIRRLIVICTKIALKYDIRLKLLKDQEGIRFIYAIGHHVIERDKWLTKVTLLEQYIDKLRNSYGKR